MVLCSSGWLSSMMGTLVAVRLMLFPTRLESALRLNSVNPRKSLTDAAKAEAQSY